MSWPSRAIAAASASFVCPWPRREANERAHLERARALHAAHARPGEQREQRIDVVGPRGERELLHVIGDGLVREARGALDVAARLDRRGELEEVLRPRLARFHRSTVAKAWVTSSAACLSRRLATIASISFGIGRLSSYP